MKRTNERVCDLVEVATKIEDFLAGYHATDNETFDICPELGIKCTVLLHVKGNTFIRIEDGKEVDRICGNDMAAPVETIELIQGLFKDCYSWLEMMQRWDDWRNRNIKAEMLTFEDEDSDYKEPEFFEKDDETFEEAAERFEANDGIWERDISYSLDGWEY